MRETNPNSAGSPPSMLSTLNCSDLWKFSYQPPRLCLQPSLLLSSKGRLSTANMTSNPLQPLLEKPQLLPAALTPVATCSTRPDPQSWRIPPSGKIYCDLGKYRKDPKKICFIFLCFLLVCVIDASCGGRSGINFFQLNLVFSHHKNRSSSNLGEVPSISFLP